MRDPRSPFDIERTLDEMKDIRVTAGLSQQQLADMGGWPRTYIVKWESREIQPDYTNLVMLHRILCGLRLQQEAKA